MLKKLINCLWPMCPSGIGHRIRVGLVTNINGRTFCWHRDCMAANSLDCRQHAHHWEPAFHYDDKLYERCTCGAHRIYGQNAHADREPASGDTVGRDVRCPRCGAGQGSSYRSGTVTPSDRTQRAPFVTRCYECEDILAPNARLDRPEGAAGGTHGH